MRNKSTLYILLSGALWGLMGIFVRRLTACGFTSLQISALRLSVAAVLFDIYLLFSGSARVRPAAKDLPAFLGLGVLSIFGMTVFYFSSIQASSLCTAAVLLYTAPAFVMLMSVVFFKEKLTSQKLVSLLIAFCGCVLVSLEQRQNTTFNASGVILGLFSGICYALYSIFGTVLLKKYPPMVVTAYGFSIAAIASLFAADLPGLAHTFNQAQTKPGLCLLIFLTGLISAFLPYMLYTIGLKHTHASRAAIMASAEPLVATLAGIAFYNETMGIFNTSGMLCILFAILLINNFGRKTNAA